MVGCFVDLKKKKKLEPTSSLSSSSCSLQTWRSPPPSPCLRCPVCLQAAVSLLYFSLRLGFSFLKATCHLRPYCPLSLVSSQWLSRDVFLGSGVMPGREGRRRPLGHFGTLRGFCFVSGGNLSFHFSFITSFFSLPHVFSFLCLPPNAS